MPRFAANLSLLFTELPFLERFSAAAHAGFRAVECQFPYDADAQEVRGLLVANGLTMELHNLPAGDWAAGDRGLGCLPDRRQEFREGVQRGMEFALTLGVPRLNLLAGVRPSDTPEASAWSTLLDNAAYAADALNAQGLDLLIEPINTFDVPGFFVNRTHQALELMAVINRPNVYLQYDVYHAQRMEGELSRTLMENLDRIGHIQVADNPGRHEPGTGEIHFPHLFQLLDASGYQGYIGCEYHPSLKSAGGTLAGLDWMRRLTDPASL